MNPTSLQLPLQLLGSLILAQKILPYTLPRLPLQLTLTVVIYLGITFSVVLPFKVLIYQPFLSPLRHVPDAPPELNNWKTWLAAEPSPPQLLQWVKRMEDYAGFQGMMRYRGIGGNERILVCKSPALKEVLVTQQYSHFDRPAMARKRIAVQAGNGLIASSGDIHKAQKRILLPAFSARACKDLYPLFWTKAHELVNALQDHMHKPTESKASTIEITSWTSRSALDIIGVAAWGHDFSAIAEPSSDFLKSYSAMFDISGGGPFINALALVIPMKYAMQIPVPYNKRLKHALHTVRTKCKQVVRERLSAGETESNKDILSLLIRGKIRDEDTLVNQMMTILAAGHDTSSLTLAWACYVLGQHQDVQRHLRDEIRASHLPVRSGTDMAQGDARSLQDLTYLQAVANEILRLYPSVPVTRREALQDAIVQGHRLPEGSHMVLSGWVVNRMEEQWGPTAADFNPGRWLEPPQVDRMDSFAFASFSHGPRSCIGQSFARGEFLVFLAALVGNFHMELAEPDSKAEVLFGITMSPAGGIQIRLQGID